MEKLLKTRFRTVVVLCACAGLTAGCTDGNGVDHPAIDEGRPGVPTGTYAIDRSHTYVTFRYLHQGLSYPLIRATSVDGELAFDSTAIGNSRADIAIEAQSIRTNTPYFDKELASPKFFNAARYPHITFTTDRYEPASDTAGDLHGRITIRDISRPVTLAVTINGAMRHPVSGKPIIGVSADASLNRSDFDLDRFIPAVADRVDISIEAEFVLGSNESSAAAARLARDTIGQAVGD